MEEMTSEEARKIGGGPGYVATMDEAELLKVRRFVRSSNDTNKSVKIFLDIREDILLSIEVRFMAISTAVSSDTAKKVFDAIEILSHQCIFPERDERRLKNGILHMDVSYIGRRCGAKNIIDPLKEVVQPIIDILQGKKNIP